MIRERDGVGLTFGVWSAFDKVPVYHLNLVSLHASSSISLSLILARSSPDHDKIARGR